MSAAYSGALSDSGSKARKATKAASAGISKNEIISHKSFVTNTLIYAGKRPRQKHSLRLGVGAILRYPRVRSESV